MARLIIDGVTLMLGSGRFACIVSPFSLASCSASSMSPLAEEMNIMANSILSLADNRYIDFAIIAVRYPKVISFSNNVSLFIFA